MGSIQPSKSKTPRGFKVCRTCGQLKRVGAFRRNTTRADGRMPDCNACRLTRTYELPAGVQEAYDQRRAAQTAQEQATRERVLQEQAVKPVTKRKPVSPEHQRHLVRLHLYGLTPDQFDAILLAQHNVCAICGRIPSEIGRRGWHVDHDHATGKVRGLLCAACNIGLGYFQDKPARLVAAIAYLEKHQT